jgi:dihydrodipicolinate synthase/N-acetylneuraminate lyase
VVGPYYYSDHTEYEVLEHFKEVGARVAAPMLVYNNAEYSGYDISPALMVKLQEAVPQIFGTKLSTNSFEVALRYLDQLPKDFAVFGLSSALMPAAFYGIRGTIVPPQSAYPELAVALWRAIEARDLEEALRLQMTINELSKATSACNARRCGCAASRSSAFRAGRPSRWPMPIDRNCGTPCARPASRSWRRFARFNPPDRQRAQGQGRKGRGGA